jgi:hypothetical protein
MAEPVIDSVVPNSGAPNDLVDVIVHDPDLEYVQLAGAATKVFLGAQGGWDETSEIDDAHRMPVTAFDEAAGDDLYSITCRVPAGATSGLIRVQTGLPTPTYTIDLAGQEITTSFQPVLLDGSSEDHDWPGYALAFDSPSRVVAPANGPVLMVDFTLEFEPGGDPAQEVSCQLHLWPEGGSETVSGIVSGPPTDPLSHTAQFATLGESEDVWLMELRIVNLSVLGDPPSLAGGTLHIREGYRFEP